MNVSIETHSGKKQYVPPTLVIYGNIRSLTNTIGMGAIMDNINPGNDAKSM